MERLALSAEEQQQVYADCAIPAEDCDKPLSVQAFTALAEQLRKSSVYRNFVQEKSQAAEAAAMTYLEQAGLLRDVRLGIVDSGWNGSMQNCLMTLLEKGAGKPLPNLKGYYFGLYTEPKQGTWEAWYFDPLTPLKKVIRFNNNVYECMCAAPHGTTMGYTIKEDGMAVPVCKPMGAVDQANAGSCRTAGANLSGIYRTGFAAGFVFRFCIVTTRRCNRIAVAAALVPPNSRRSTGIRAVSVLR